MAIKQFFRENMDSEIKVSEIRLLIPAGKASNDAPVGPTLSQFGVNALEFCKEFNEVTKKYKINGVLLSVIVTKIGKKFSINIKGPSVTSLIYICSFNKTMLSKSYTKEKALANGFCIFISDIYYIAKLRYFFETSTLKQNQRPRTSFKSMVDNVLSTVLTMDISVIWDV